MKLESKKDLVARTLGVGKNRIVFNAARLSEVKEAITKQDVRDLHASGAIHVKPSAGRKKVRARKTRRRFGSVKKKVVNGKRQYMTLTRKLRRYLFHLKKTNQIDSAVYIALRKEIRASMFRNLSHMKERISSLLSSTTGGKQDAKNTKAKKKRKKN